MSDRIRAAVFGMAAINAVGMLGLGWFVATTLIYDGFMIVELSICGGLIALLAALTWGGFALARGGRTGAALVMLAVVALPTAAAICFLFWLDANPIDWR